MIAYVYDEKIHESLNQAGHNYWDIYLEEIFRFLGVKGRKLGLKDIENPLPSDVRVLIVGAIAGANLSAKMRGVLKAWVEQGGILIGFAVPKMDKIFGIKEILKLKQENDDYTISACFDLRPHALTHEIHPLMFKEQKIPVVSDGILAELEEDSAELARLCDINGNVMKYPAITWHQHGEGFTGWFAFDVPKTIWLLHQGRPIPESAGNHRRGPRTLDLCILGRNSRKIPYADEICFVLQNMIAQAGVVFVYQIPPKNGKVTDALLYWGGDEYAGPTELSLTASDWMRENGLAYHINLEAENHPITKAEYKHIIEDNSHEISEYYHRIEEYNWQANEEMYIRQSNEFEVRFGHRPITTVNGVLQWNGWVDSARWMEVAGSKVDNSFGSHEIPLDHPEFNMPCFGFGFGTSYPFDFYDDHKHGNKRIDLMEQPIVCYEIGHRGSLVDAQTKAAEDVHLPIEMSIKYHWVMNMFYHPVYIAKYPECRAAITEILATIDRACANVVHMGNDELYYWWRAREAAEIKQTVTLGKITADVSCGWKDGMILKVLAAENIVSIKVDGVLGKYEVKNEFAGNWVYIVLLHGSHNVEMFFETN